MLIIKINNSAERIKRDGIGRGFFQIVTGRGDPEKMEVGQ